MERITNDQLNLISSMIGNYGGQRSKNKLDKNRYKKIQSFIKILYDPSFIYNVKLYSITTQKTKIDNSITNYHNRNRDIFIQFKDGRICLDSEELLIYGIRDKLSGRNVVKFSHHLEVFYLDDDSKCVFFAYENRDKRMTKMFVIVSEYNYLIFELSFMNILHLYYVCCPEKILKFVPEVGIITDSGLHPFGDDYRIDINTC
jgi:hypothetical protein